MRDVNITLNLGNTIVYWKVYYGASFRLHSAFFEYFLKKRRGGRVKPQEDTYLIGGGGEHLSHRQVLGIQVHVG
jgi:hypothetical protein